MRRIVCASLLALVLSPAFAQEERCTKTIRMGGGALAPTSLTVLPDGKRAITGSSRSANLWDLDGEVLERKLYDGAVNAVAVFADGSRVAIACDDGAARVYEVASGRLLRALRAPGSLKSVAVSPDGTRLAAGGEGGALINTLEQIGRAHV